MLVKFWGINQGGGDGDGSVNYLLNERVERGTAKVLKGDANLTKSLLLSLTQKHKACVGCLSFEESNIDESLKYELMESFENALLTESMQNRYNILWVEHTDKGRLELNFVIPKIDLDKQKAFNPYYHKVDLKRIDTWKDCINLKHNFTNPKDLEKQHNIQQHQTKNPQNKELLATYEKLDKLIQDNLGKLFNSREDIINFLKANQCEVNRQGKDYISVKLPNEPKAKRLKGFYYHETFRTIKDIRNQLSEARQRESQRERSNSHTTNDNHTELLRELENKLHERIEHKQRYYERLHQADPSNPRDLKEQPPRTRESQQEIQGNYTRGFTRDKETNSQKFNRESSQENLTDAFKFPHGVSRNGSNINGGILSHHSALQKQGIRAFTERKFATQTADRPTRKRQSAKILPTNADQEIKRKNAERILKQATERFNQRNRELAERQERVINQARESYSRISKTKQRLLEIRERNLELERELRNAIANTQYATKEISIIRSDRESRIKEFTDNVRSDFTTRITERSNQRARDFTSSIQRITNSIRGFRDHAQTRVRTILHSLHARTKDTINTIRSFYTNAKERIRDFFQRADEPLSKRMEQETRELYARTTQLDGKIREHNQKIDDERSYSCGYGR
ncbi:molybdopterin-guanine dinucleotide biosynthesis protein MobA [Helicobacter pylori]|uniref:relaxase/mobilization nuclease domain-containing protein n=1 Tax=Helicobacter pylori TaxID=210 RepID=UPI0013F3F496|nr:relaxase/mobilization nuclease domain-containing protein [Helicobacter pylori]NHA87354.1 molybdopterin-guanine dinucleotide biosynthesis protein MobA [Helicobacter pylori]